MNMTLNKRWCLTAILALSAVVYTSSSYAATDRLVIESGDSAQSRQQASMEKEQWNDTRSLRQKVNKRAEKEWDKTDVAFDAQDNCQKSANVNAYWEPNTLLAIAVAIGSLTSFFGAWLSYYLDGATGGIIVVAQTLLFLITFIFAPKHGLLASRRRAREAAC